MGKAVTVRGRLADPRHIELEEPIADVAGTIEVVLRPVEEPADTTRDRVSLARMLQTTAPHQTTDSIDLVRQDRLR